MPLAIILSFYYGQFDHGDNQGKLEHVCKILELTIEKQPCEEMSYVVFQKNLPTFLYWRLILLKQYFLIYVYELLDY